MEKVNVGNGGDKIQEGSQTTAEKPKRTRHAKDQSQYHVQGVQDVLQVVLEFLFRLGLVKMPIGTEIAHDAQ